MRSIQTDKGYILRLERGESVFEEIVQFAVREDIQAAELSGIGAVEEVTLGSYNLKKKEYDKRSIPDILEVVALLGNIAIVDEAPFLHVHAVFSDAELQCFGGHVFDMKVAVTLEVFVTPHDTTIVREMDSAIGLKLCTFPG